MKAIENIGIHQRYFAQTWMYKPDEIPEDHWDNEDWKIASSNIHVQARGNSRTFLEMRSKNDWDKSSLYLWLIVDCKR